MRKNLRDECYKETESRCEEMYVSWLEERVFSLESEVEKFTCAQHRQPKICPIAQIACLHFNGDNCDLKLECVYEPAGKLQAGA
jgi:hypothetical protein